MFSYTKAAIVQDIIANEAKILSHPLLQAISGDLTAYNSSFKEPLPASALDYQIKPERLFQILDADSSQQVVIEAAKSGSSFVVQGPPGTGKSQTIVNMMAELIGNGKSVLLVAEKETALSVVYKRMAECNLDHVCLNLHHSGTTDKRALVHNLSRTIDYLAQISVAEKNDLFFERLAYSRQSINSYIQSLHTKEKPLDKSPFEIFGELLKKEREEIPNINIIFSNFSQWTPSRLEEAKHLLNQLAGFLEFLQGTKSTIWQNSKLKYYSYELQLEIEEKLRDFQEAITEIKKISQTFPANLQTKHLLKLEDIEALLPSLQHILNVPPLPEHWTKLDISLAHQTFSQLQNDVKFLESNEPYLKHKYKSELFSSELPA
ncbi:MAG: AAA domain-containing protein [Nostocaceae cyanobacterium]|nr:AAA domain-containing protein [Nostocaceae cyanobacterium]